MADPITNFFSSTLVGTYSDTDTSLTIANGSGAKLPDPSVDGEFNLVIFNESEIGVVTTFDGGSTDTREDLGGTNPEIVRVTAKSGDVLTVTRGQEGTSASAKQAGNTYRVILSATKKVFDDIQTAIENVDLTTLTGVEELTFDSTGDEEFGLPAGTTAQRPASPSAGYMRWNSTDSRIEFYNGTRWAGLSEIGLQQETMEVAQLSVTANDAVAIPALEVEYLVIAGGGGGARDNFTSDRGAGGGGAGGYRSSVVGESSGGGASAESVFEPELSTSYTVTVGAGGAGGTTTDTAVGISGTDGSNSVFNTTTSDGGGGGGGHGSNFGAGGRSGGSGGGSCNGNSGGSGTANQGFDGGDATSSDTVYNGSGGGGAGAIGGDADNTTSGNGGAGVSSSITGSSVTRAGGGGGRGDSNNGSGGSGGGGAGGGVSGTTNTGSGGGANRGANGGNGGSGVVILRYSSDYSISIGAGLTGSETTDGSEKYAVITAGTGNVSWT